jgi:plasmid stability protein
MASLTVRNLPDRLVDRLKRMAKGHGNSMEQEVREILQEKLESRSDLLDRIQERARRIPSPTAEEVNDWISDARNRRRL